MYKLVDFFSGDLTVRDQVERRDDATDPIPVDDPDAMNPVLAQAARDGLDGCIRRDAREG